MKKQCNRCVVLLLLCGSLLQSSLLQAVEIAPRISDREMIESLAELKAGQRQLQKEMDHRFESVDQRFESVDQRFESIDQRLNSLESTMLTLFSALIMLIVALFGYIAWDRRTALRPLEREMQSLKRDLERDLDLQSPEGSLLTRSVQALRELAKEDQKVAQALRNFSLL